MDVSCQQIVPPVLESFVDQDSRVRYYACEALYNIAKVRMEMVDSLIYIYPFSCYVWCLTYCFILACRWLEEILLFSLTVFLMPYVNFRQIQIPMYKALLIFWIGL